MPCRSDYMKPDQFETRMSEVCTLLDELDGKDFNRHNWNGYHPAIYSQHIERKVADELVSDLCSRIQSIDPKDYSLELQIWWRDHQEADRERLKMEIKENKNKKDRKKALKKLTKYERELLGVDD